MTSPKQPDDRCDEDKMIEIYGNHRDLTNWTIGRLESEGIKSEATRGNDSKGDILYHNEGDETRVKEIVREIHRESNP
jgi:hypothetical protein